MSAATKTLPTLAEVDAYPVPELLVPRLMKVYKLQKDFAEGIVREAKRMLYLSQLSGKPVCPSVEIDDAWHEMIVFTRFYHQFCAFIGTDYIHHTPEPDVPAGTAGQQGVSLYDETLKNYEATLKQKPDPRFWTP